MTAEQTGTTNTRPMPVFDKPLPEDSFYDEIRVITRERWKDSSLSGAEWRFHRVLQLYRKGVLLAEEAFNGNIDQVASFAPWWMTHLRETGNMAGAHDPMKCFQPVCPADAAVEYELIAEFCRQGERLDAREISFPKRRRFCQRHAHRGDCSREDCDANYRKIEGPTDDR